MVRRRGVHGAALRPAEVGQDLPRPPSSPASRRRHRPFAVAVAGAARNRSLHGVVTFWGGWGGLRLGVVPALGAHVGPFVEVLWASANVRLRAGSTSQLGHRAQRRECDRWFSGYTGDHHVIDGAASSQALAHRPAAAARLAAVLWVLDARHALACAHLRFDLDCPIALCALQEGAG